MAEEQTCPNCGATLPPNAPAGQCPGCLFRIGIALTNGGVGFAAEEPLSIDKVKATSQHSKSAFVSRKIRYIGDYELLEEIAHGGMGIVYKARQASLNRVVALKMIRAGELANEQEVARFRDEAEATGSLRHPNIVAIHEVGEHEGRQYFSMDFIEGKNMAHLVREHPWSPERAAACVQTIAEAIHYAHQRGILHRDLKPSNVVIDVFDAPHITDFGLAKWIEEDSKLTVSGAVLGTPSYLAPEQTMGRRITAGAASDVYSMGAILYELLTGRPPFQGETTLDTLKLVRETEPVSPRLLNPKLPRDLETVCLKCLEKEPKRRYGSAQEFADDLGRFLRREPIRAWPSSALQRTLKWTRRKPALAGLTAVTCIAALALAGFGISVPAYRKAERARIDEQRQRYKTEAALKQAERAQEAEATQRKRAETESDRAVVNLYLANIAGAELARQNQNFDRANRLLEECPPHLRNWEWHYLRRLCRSELDTLRGHETNVVAVAFVGDGGRLASISADGVLRGWNVVAGSPDFTVRISPKGIFLAAFSKDGSRLITDRGWPDSIQVWDAAAGTEVFAVRSNSWASSVAISTNGELIAVATDDRAIRVWNLVTRQLVRTLKGFVNPVYCLAFSPTAKYVGAGGGEWEKSGEVGLWDLDSARMMTLSGITNTALCLDFSPDGELVAATGLDQTVRIWNAKTGQVLHSFVHDDAAGTPGSAGDYRSLHYTVDYVRAVRGIVFSPDSKRIASCGDEGTVKVWEVATGIEELIYRGRTRRAQAIAFSRDGNRLASGGEDFSLKVRNFAPKPQAIRIKGYSEGLAFSGDGKRLTSGEQVWSALDGTLLAGAATKTTMGRPAFSPDGERTATGLQIFDARTGSLIRTMGWTDTVIGYKGGPNGTLIEPRPVTNPVSVYGVSFSPDGRMLATGRGNSKPGDVKLWDVASGQELQTFTGHTNQVWDVAFSPDGHYLATSSGDFEADLRTWRIPGEARLWDVKTSKVLQIHTTPHCLYSVCFSGDGRRFAASGGFHYETETNDRGTIKVWDVQTGQEAFSATNLRSCVYSVALSPDGKRLVAAVGDWGEGGPFDVRLWDVESGREILTLGKHAGPVHAVAFSPDGKRIASASAFDDNTIHIWSCE